jgi:hypothetical protein
MRFNRSILTAITTLSGIAFTVPAAAIPAGEPRCPTNINVPGGSGAYYGEDCRTIYVPPPEEAVTRVSTISPRQNLDLCPGVAKVNEGVKATLVSIGDLSSRLATMTSSFDPLSARLKELEAALVDANQAREVAKAAFDSTANELEVLEADLDAAVGELQECRRLALDPVLDCQSQAASVAAARTSLRNFMQSTYLPAQRVLSEAEARVASQEERLLDEAERYQRATESIDALTNTLLNLNERLFAVYQQYARLAGLVAALNYSVGWGDLLKAYADANPGKVIERLAIKNTRLSAGVVIEDAKTDVPGVLSYSVPGVLSGTNFMNMPTGEETSGMTEEHDPTKQYEGVFGDAIGAQLLVSLAAACPYYPNGFSGGQQGDINGLSANLSMNVSYNYDVKVRRGYTAQYNLSQWLRRIERTKKRGGLFSSKVLREVIEDGNSSDWFKISFDEVAKEFQYTDEEQARITAEVKGQLVERALRNVALQTSMLTGANPQPITVPPSGAGLAASYLIPGCGFWSWCTVTGWVLGVADSIFGRSEAVQNFHRNNNVWVTDTVSGVSILSRFGSLTFTPPAP